MEADGKGRITSIVEVFVMKSVANDSPVCSSLSDVADEVPPKAAI